MKKIIACLSLVLVVALGVVGFSACKKKRATKPEDAFVGCWKIYKSEEYDEDGQLCYVSTVKPEDNDLMIYKFNANGSVEINYPNRNNRFEVWESYKWEIVDGVATLTDSRNAITYTLTIEGNNLYLKHTEANYLIVLIFTKVK